MVKVTKRLADFSDCSTFDGVGALRVPVVIRKGRKVIDTVVFDAVFGPEASDLPADVLDVIDKCLWAGWVRGDVGVEYSWKVKV